VRDWGGTSPPRNCLKINGFARLRGAGATPVPHGVAPAPPESSKAINFEAISKFFGSKPTAKSDKICIYYMKKKRDSFHLAR